VSAARRAAHCRWCQVPITWATNEANGHRVPMEVGPSPDGTIHRSGRVDFDGTPIVRLYPNPQLAANADIAAPRYVNHLAVCTKRRRPRAG
jgi:hypothetical protein